MHYINKLANFELSVLGDSGIAKGVCNRLGVFASMLNYHSDFTAKGMDEISQPE